jgi:hypothetical protein
LPAQAELTAAFTAGLADGVLPPGVTATAPDETARRFAVYRNNVAVSLSRALAQRFPVIERLVGEAFFSAMARAYHEAHRPASPVLLEWGDSFPGFLAAFPPLASYPYMASVAQVELARGRAFHAADADPMPVASLIAAAADPGSAHLWLHPSVQILALTHPGASIWSANQPGATTRGAPVTGAETALVLRDTRFAVPVAVIGPGDAALIRALAEGETLFAAAERAASEAPGHDPQPILVHLMQAGAIVTQPEHSA